MKGDEKYEEFLIKAYKYWRIYLHQNQGILGRAYLWCIREDAVDFLQMTENEKEEFFKVARDLKRALVKLFRPDLFNYSSLGNETNHLHIHMLPRYANNREFAGQTFADPRWGYSYRSRKDFKIDRSTLLKIKDAIKTMID